MKILIAGLGGIGQRHLRNLRAMLGAGLEICAVDPRSDIPVLTDRLEVEEEGAWKRNITFASIPTWSLL